MSRKKTPAEYEAEKARRQQEEDEFELKLFDTATDIACYDVNIDFTGEQHYALARILLRLGVVK